MKKTLLVSAKYSKYLLFVLVVQLNYCFAAEDTLKVLFIGNSLTYFNEMPGMFQNISLNKNKLVKAQYYAPGGTGVVNHVVDPDVYALFRQEWDVLVVQPGTGESPGVSWPIDTTRARTQKLLDSLHSYNPCARAFIYEIPYGIPSSNGYATYFSTQQKIRDSISVLADGLHIQVIPAGESARAYYSLHQDVSLHNSMDDIHPNANGSFLTALSCYATIFQEPVTGCTFFSSVDQARAQEFFSIVDTVVLNRADEWNINTYNLHAAFDFEKTGYTVDFESQSVNHDALEWHFGDVETSEEEDPSHTYAGPGTYLVKLYAFSNGCADSTDQQVVLSDILSTGNELLEGITVFPNPATDVIHLSNKLGNSTYVVYDMNGNTLLDAVFTGTGEKYIDVSTLAAGQYIVKMTTDSVQRFFTFQKE